MFRGIGDLREMMAKAQDLQQKMTETQQRLKSLEVEGAAGAGMVTATVNGVGALLRLRVDPSLLSPAADAAQAIESKAMLEDLTVAAVNDAQAKARDKAQEEMRAATDGLPLPPGLGFPA